MTRFLTLDEVQYLHERAMAAMDAAASPLRGGDFGLAQLDSAVNRPRQIAVYQPDIDDITLAAVLAVSIAQVQAYIDGNKRTAYVALGTFLRLNGWLVDLDDGGLAVADQLELIAERTRDDRRALDQATTDFAHWLQQHVTRAS